MKTISLILMCAFVIFGLSACDRTDSNSITGTDIPDVEPITGTTGDYHDEFLDTLHAAFDKAASKSGSLDKSAKSNITVEVTNQMLTKYGLAPMDPAEIRAQVQRGAEMATRTKEFTMEGILFGDELTWWNRYSMEAHPWDAKKVYNRHCRLYGAPEPGSTLESVITTVISSCRIWSQRHPEAEPYIPCEDNGEKGWLKNLVRFVVAVGVDGAAGGLAGSAGGPIAGGVVGGLASHGADDILFGD